MPPTEKMATESDHREVRSSWETALPLLSDSVLLKNFRMICKRNQVARVTIQREAFYSVESRYYCPPSASMKTERDTKAATSYTRGQKEELSLRSSSMMSGGADKVPKGQQCLLRKTGYLLNISDDVTH